MSISQFLGLIRDYLILSYLLPDSWKEIIMLNNLQTNYKIKSAAVASYVIPLLSIYEHYSTAQLSPPLEKIFVDTLTTSL